MTAFFCLESNGPMESELEKTAVPGRLPVLLTFLGRHLALGVAAGLVFAASLVLTDTGGLGVLLESSDDRYLALFLLYAFNALTFGSIAMGIGVMSLPLELPTQGRAAVDRRNRDTALRP
jgi:hypothetical protein